MKTRVKTETWMSVGSSTAVSAMNDDWLASARVNPPTSASIRTRWASVTRAAASAPATKAAQISSPDTGIDGTATAATVSTAIKATNAKAGRGDVTARKYFRSCSQEISVR